MGAKNTKTPKPRPNKAAATGLGGSSGRSNKIKHERASQPSDMLTLGASLDKLLKDKEEVGADEESE